MEPILVPGGSMYSGEHSAFRPWKQRYLQLVREFFVKDRKLRVVFSLKRKNATGHCVYCSNDTHWVRRIDQASPLPDNVVCEDCVRLMDVDPIEITAKWRVVDPQLGSTRFYVPDEYMMERVDIRSVMDLMEPPPLVPVGMGIKEEYEGEIEMSEADYYSCQEDEETREFDFFGENN